MSKLPLTCFRWLLGGVLLTSAWAQPGKEIIHDAEYYVLEAQLGEKWAQQDERIQAKLEALREKHGTPRDPQRHVQRWLSL